MIGDFAAPLPNSEGVVDGSAYLQRALEELRDLTDLKVAGQTLESIVCNRGSCGGRDPAVLTITDKHGLTQRAMNTHLQVVLGGKTLSLGLPVA
ncbi:hypothetical protein NOR51B_2288 [Luminiphilus syltensis NOR5-1B]|uniref:Uncharacterized protein n=1 Tax=Luminiphilus syltensis NOR5-1B TaxID=565045 RepID=B8KYB1_9GAMM|nr:hypothetical protein NOR51B_2288 [Luminiphilus syltensis NOR5-1B]